MPTAGIGEVGNECALFYATDLARPSPPAGVVAIPGAIDVDLTLSSSAGTFASRRSSFEAMRVALFTVELTFGYDLIFGQVDDDTVYDALRAAYFAKTIHEYFVLDGGTITGGAFDVGADAGEGVRFYGQIHDMSESQPVQDAVTANFVVRNTRVSNAGVIADPVWFQIPAA